MRVRLADFYLLLFFVGAVAFTVWEAVAVLPKTPTHTISYWAHQYVWFRVLVGVVLPVAFSAWFMVHAARPVPK